jgi:hypothetical protein
LRLGLATTASTFENKVMDDAWTCQGQCQLEKDCIFVQWNFSTKICQFFNGDVEGIYKNHDSILGARNCSNIASLWKKKPIAVTSTTAPTTTSKTPRKISSPSDAGVSSGGETATSQNATTTRYCYYNRESK